jgi:hypothetical protein
MEKAVFLGSDCFKRPLIDFESFLGPAFAALLSAIPCLGVDDTVPEKSLFLKPRADFGVLFTGGGVADTYAAAFYPSLEECVDFTLGFITT